jgi:small subunit ribosomal protein S1
MIDLTTSKDLIKKYRLPPAELDRLVDEICGDADLDALLFGGDSYNHHSVAVEDIVEGKIIDIKNDFVLVDYGGKMEAKLPYTENNTSNEDLDIGDTTKFLVTNVTEEGTLSLSRKNVELLIRQKQILQTLTVGDRLSGTLIQRTKTGWVVNLNGLPAILPSQQEYMVYDRNAAEDLIDTQVEVEIESINEKLVTLTRKPFATKIKKEAKASFFNSLNVGDLVDGLIKNITEFGAFIQISSGIIGLCHTSDFGPEEIKVGNKTKCRVLKLDREKSRVSLGIRQVTEPSWAEIVAKYSEEEKVSATVRSIVPYGAFLELEPGISGLVHVSDLSWSDHVKHPREVLAEGDTVEAVILGIDADKQHLSLGLKQISSDPWQTITDRYLVGSVYEGKIANKTKFGIFVTLESGVEGLAHHTVDSENMQVGEDVMVSILRIDAVRKKISLAIDE